MRPATLLAEERGPQHQPRDKRHVLLRSTTWAEASRLIGQLLKLREANAETGPAALDAGAPLHKTTQACADPHSASLCSR